MSRIEIPRSNIVCVNGEMLRVEKLLAIIPDVDGWRKTPVGNRVRIGSGVSIGDNTFLGNNTCIGSGVHIGRDTYIGPDVSICSDVHISKGAHIGHKTYITVHKPTEALQRKRRGESKGVSTLEKFMDELMKDDASEL
jgi:UDP-3-O-[3-hydroxymyristoyl] glucosamine N-acyltransferase